MLGGGEGGRGGSLGWGGGEGGRRGSLGKKELMIDVDLSVIMRIAIVTVANQHKFKFLMC